MIKKKLNMYKLTKAIVFDLNDSWRVNRLNLETPKNVAI